MMQTKTKFKQTEIGMIPEDWDVKKMQDVVTKLGDGLHGTPKYDDSGTYYFVNGNNLAEGKIKLNKDTKKCSKEEFEKYKKELSDRTILVSINGTLGNIAIYNYEKIILGKSACYLNIRKECNLLFIKYVLKDKKFQSHIQNNATGTTIKNVSLKQMREYKFGIPTNTKEQQHIEKILSDLDSKIEINQQVNKTLEAISKAIFKHWFIDFEFPNEKGEPYNTSGGEMVYNEEVGKEIPKEWELKNIGDVVIVKGGTTPSTKNVEYWNNGKINWCTPKDLSRLNSTVLLDTERKITERGLSVISSDLLPIGTVLLSSRAPIGYLAISEIPISINQGFIAIVCNKVISKYFMLFWLQQNMDEIKSRAHGTTFEEINKNSFRNIRIIVPPTYIINNYDELMHALYNKIVENEKETKTLTYLRNSLLPKLMSGKIRVPVGVR